MAQLELTKDKEEYVTLREQTVLLLSDRCDSTDKNLCRVQLDASEDFLIHPDTEKDI